MTYLQTMIREYARFSPDTYRVTLGEGEETLETEAFVLVVANASQYGNNAYIAPEADLSDGLLDLVLIRPFSPIEAPIVLGDLMRRRLGGNKYYSAQKTTQVCIERSQPGPVHVDGEPLELGTTLRVSLHHRALQVIVPA